MQDANWLFRTEPMHSSIILIDKCPIEEGTEIYPEDIEDNLGVRYSTRLKKPSQRKRLQEFLKELPEGMFELENENELVYKGGMEEWKARWIAKLKYKANHLNLENCLELKTQYDLRNCLKNALDTDILFVIPYYGDYGITFKSTKFMELINELQPGECVYIGNILDYHY